jgi:hypothetical protein
MSIIMRARSGAVKAALIQNRRFMSISSGLTSSPVISRGSSAMPQIGQGPGLSRTISGCIGHVYSTRVAGGRKELGSRAIPHFGQLPGVSHRTSASIGQVYSMTGAFAGGAAARGAGFRYLSGWALKFSRQDRLQK